MESLLEKEKTGSTLVGKSRVGTLSIHACAPDFTEVLVSSRWVLGKWMDKIRSNPNYLISSIIQDVAQVYNVDISVSQAYKVKRDALRVIHGDYKEQFGQLLDYCNALINTNDGKDCVKLKFARVTIDDEVKIVFQRIFVSFEAAKNDFLAGCRLVVGLDGTFLKGLYGGILLTATCNDDNNNCMVLAYAVVENECYDTWKWFMDHFVDYTGGSTYNELGSSDPTNLPNL